MPLLHHLLQRRKFRACLTRLLDDNFFSNVVVYELDCRFNSNRDHRRRGGRLRDACDVPGRVPSKLGKRHRRMGVKKRDVGAGVAGWAPSGLPATLARLDAR